MDNRSNSGRSGVALTGRSMHGDVANSEVGQVTIVMYHYVRPLARTRFPDIKGLDLEDFRAQIELIDRHYEVISLPQLIGAIDGEHALPENAALLTFDDGYADHYDYAMPILDEHGISGIFFPPVTVVRERRVLDVNKIHFILASGIDIHKLIKRMHAHLRNYRDEYNLPAEKSLFERYAAASRFDPKEVIYVKRLLQKGLPEKVRSAIVDALFTDIVTRDEEAFAEELYMSEDQLRYALGNGFFVGGHGVEHVWLDSLHLQKKKKEIVQSKQFLMDLGVPKSILSIAYPYGAWDKEVHQLAKILNFRAGFTTDVDVANVGLYDSLLLPRCDTNDLLVQ